MAYLNRIRIKLPDKLNWREYTQRNMKCSIRIAGHMKCNVCHRRHVFLIEMMLPGEYFGKPCTGSIVVTSPMATMVGQRGR